MGDARDTVKVEVALSVAPTYNIDVYLRSFDVDDPSAATNAVDKDIEDGGSNDNRGEVLDENGAWWCNGLFVTENGAIDQENGIKTNSFPVGVEVTNCLFKVTRQPGDNFRIVASGDKQFLDALENQDVTQHVGNTDGERNENKQRICHQNVTGTPAEREVRKADKYVSPTLTVWRFLHLEADSMAAPGPNDNIETGRVTKIVDGSNVHINVNLRTELNDNSTNLTHSPPWQRTVREGMDQNRCWHGDAGADSNHQSARKWRRLSQKSRWVRYPGVDHKIRFAEHKR